MLLSAVSVFVVAQSIFEIPEGLMNNPVQYGVKKKRKERTGVTIHVARPHLFRP